MRHRIGIISVVFGSLALQGCGPTLEQFFQPDTPKSTHDPNYVACHSLKLIRWNDDVPARTVYAIKIYNATLRGMCPPPAVLEYYPLPPLTLPPIPDRPAPPPAEPTS